MTTSHPPTFTLTVEVEPTALVIHVHGDLDHETCDELMRAVDQNFADGRTPEGRVLELRVDFAGLGSIDSMGLSVLLMIRRRTDAAGVDLRLDERPPAWTACWRSRARWTISPRPVTRTRGSGDPVPADGPYDLFTSTGARRQDRGRAGRFPRVRTG